MTTDPHQPPLNVLIAGGGVAALETMMALRTLAGDRVLITLLAPDRNFHYRPMAVCEPFTIAHARRIELARIAGEFGAHVISAPSPPSSRSIGASHARGHANRLRRRS